VILAILAIMATVCRYPAENLCALYVFYSAILTSGETIESNRNMLCSGIS
jgi:hypothetical protein